MPQQKLDEALEQLASAELIFRRGTPPDSQYTFKHALVQDAAYSTLLRSRRQQLHARTATTLESQFTEIAQGQPELLAQHCAEAGLIDKAVSYRLKAGQKCCRAFSHAGSAVSAPERIGLTHSPSRETIERTVTGAGIASCAPSRTNRNERLCGA